MLNDDLILDRREIAARAKARETGHWQWAAAIFENDLVPLDIRIAAVREQTLDIAEELFPEGFECTVDGKVKRFAKSIDAAAPIALILFSYKSVKTWGDVH